MGKRAPAVWAQPLPRPAPGSQGQDLLKTYSLELNLPSTPQPRHRFGLAAAASVAFSSGVENPLAYGP